jgi:hypothetical protein
LFSLRNGFLTPASGSTKPHGAMRESGECCYGAQTVVFGICLERLAESLAH